MKKKTALISSAIVMSLSVIAANSFAAQEFWTDWNTFKAEDRITDCSEADARIDIDNSCNSTARAISPRASVVDKESRNFSNNHYKVCCGDIIPCASKCRRCKMYVEYRCKIYMP
jgi:hypothetical protein